MAKARMVNRNGSPAVEADGQKTIRFKHPAYPWEVYEKKSWGQGVEEITVPMVRGETLMFSLCGEI